MSLDTVDLQAFARQLVAHFTTQLSGSGLPPDEVQDNIHIIEQFNQIAVDVLQQEPGISLPGAEQLIPWGEKTATQALTLFAEGVYLGMLKCFQQGIPGDIKKKPLQEFAMDVFNQAKQVVASTYGQENTPEFQFSHEQQVALIHQAAGNALMYYINKHEQENGPIEAGPMPVGPMAVPASTINIAQPGVTPSIPPQPVQAARPVPPARPKGPTPHDKYGAVALLLNTLPAGHRAKVLQAFTAEEKNVIAFYSTPGQIEQNLDLASVEKHLKHFKVLFKPGSARPKSQGHPGLSRLAAQYPLEKLLSYVKDERPAVKQALEAIYQPTSDHPLAAIATSSAQAGKPLPSRIEDILYQHLQRRLESA